MAAMHDIAKKVNKTAAGKEKIAFFGVCGGHQLPLFELGLDMISHISGHNFEDGQLSEEIYIFEETELYDIVKVENENIAKNSIKQNSVHTQAAILNERNIKILEENNFTISSFSIAIPNVTGSAITKAMRQLEKRVRQDNPAISTPKPRDFVETLEQIRNNPTDPLYEKLKEATLIIKSVEGPNFFRGYQYHPELNTHTTKDHDLNDNKSTKSLNKSNSGILNDFIGIVQGLIKRKKEHKSQELTQEEINSLATNVIKNMDSYNEKRDFSYIKNTNELLKNISENDVKKIMAAVQEGLNAKKIGKEETISDKFKRESSQRSFEQLTKLDIRQPLIARA